MFRKVLRTYGQRLGAGPDFAHAAVRIEGEADVEALTAQLLADPEALDPPGPGGHVPTPKRPVDHW